MRGIIENNGALVFSPDPIDSVSPGVTYARVLTLRHNGDANGTLIATCDLTTLFDGHQVWPVFRSTDHGATWERISNMWDSTTGFTRQMNPFLFEMPQQMGDFEEGTLLLAGNLKPDDESTTNIMIFYSTDMGITWTHLSTVDSGGPAVYDKSPESTTTAVWEPYLAVSANGHLVCYYSDERQKDKGILQAQVQRISTDAGRTWGELQNVVGIPNRSDRPGMITMATMPNGVRLATYEVVNRPSVEVDGAPVYFKTSPDGVTWDSEDLGTPILLEDGRGIGSSPYVIWVDDSTENGMVVVGSKWALDENGHLMQGQNFFVNRNLGEGYWERLPMAVVFDSIDDNALLTGLSMSMETDITNKVIYQAVNVQNDETDLNDLRIGAIPVHFTDYEAENADLTNVNIVNHYDASNEQKVGGINYDDSSVVFNNIEVVTSGDYAILIRYDNGSGVKCTQKITINDEESQEVVFPQTKDWGRFGWVVIVAYLKAGTNKVAFSYWDGYTEIDCIWVRFQDL